MGLTDDRDQNENHHDGDEGWAFRVNLAEMAEADKDTAEEEADEGNDGDDKMTGDPADMSAETNAETANGTAEADRDRVRAEAYNDKARAYRRGIPKKEKKSTGKAGSKKNRKKGHSGGFAAAVVISLLLTAALIVGIFLILQYGTKSVMSNIIEVPGAGSSELPEESLLPPAGIPDFAPGADSDKETETDDDGDRDYDYDNLSVADVAEISMPSMVAITTTTIEEMQSYFGGQTRQYESTASGTGVILERTDDSLLIVTNNHVIDGAETISAAFIDETAAPAVVVGRDSAQDLAILSVSLNDIGESTRSRIRVITIGESEDCRVGEAVVAIGNALGYGQSVSAGIISALKREVIVDGVTHTLIQTDAAINPGNSGGALLNMKGELIGINEVKYAQTTVEGMGYAIPIESVTAYLNTLMNRTEREEVPEEQRSYLGILCMTMPDSYVQQGYPAGVYVTEVTEGQAAAAAGIAVGDIITSIDGYSVSTSEELVAELRYYAAGETVTLNYLHHDSSDAPSGYRTMTTEVTLGSRADAPETDDEAEEPEEEENSGFYTLPYFR